LERILLLLPPREKTIHPLLEQVRQRIADLSTRLREVSHQLHPSVVEHLGLHAALRGLVDDYSQNGMELSFVAGCAGGEPPLDIATALYRIAQEALRNASKHAEGAPVRMTLDETGREFQLKIEDAGPGFDLNRVRGKRGLGLL